jgi:hypothetical protein
MAERTAAESSNWWLDAIKTAMSAYAASVEKVCRQAHETGFSQSLTWDLNIGGKVVQTTYVVVEMPAMRLYTMTGWENVPAQLRAYFKGRSGADA